MKEFKICVGLTKDRMTEVLSSTLKDDNVPETFALRHTNSAGVAFPSRYLKIIPISSVDISVSRTTEVLTHLGSTAHIVIAFIYLSGLSPCLGLAARAM
jgi:hypothetical protein